MKESDKIEGVQGAEKTSSWLRYLPYRSICSERFADQACPTAMRRHNLHVITAWAYLGVPIAILVQMRPLRYGMQPATSQGHGIPFTAY